MLGLPIQTRAEDPLNGLGFKLLRWRPGEKTVTSGHKSGINATGLTLQTDPFTIKQLIDCPFHVADEKMTLDFLEMVNRWVRLSSVLNVLARSMGQPDSDPFVLTVASLRKLYLVHGVVGSGQ